MSGSRPINDRFLRALAREPVDRTPVWMMRQAGRYLPEYRAVRKRAGDFMTLCRTPELACEVTLQPLRRFALDAAILFSDILTIPDALGLGLHFVEGEGPRFERPSRTPQAIHDLPPLEVETDLAYVMDAVRLIRRELDGRVPLIGFSGSPWTLACYMVEGGSPGDFARIKTLIYDAPELAHLLLGRLSTAVTTYLNAQIRAGAQAVQIFDTWGGVLSGPAFETFSRSYLHRIVAGLIHHHAGHKVPVIVFTKGGGLWLDALADTGADALGLDWTVDLGMARRQVGKRAALQGNLDPAVLRAQPAVIREEVRRLLAAYGMGSGHVFNLGHGITPDIAVEHAHAFIEAVGELSPAYHR
jgi:uroporphyrinogen decarboxylase